MFNQHMLRCACVLVGTVSFILPIAHGHGFVGNRFFPATVSTDDPLVTDELALPTFSFYDFPGQDGAASTRTTSSGFDFSKVIVPKLSLGISTNFLTQSMHGTRSSHGWDNLTLSLKYEVWRNDPHEAIVSVGLETELGGTGSKSIGRNSFSTFVPTLYFGKGFGDLPDALGAFKPLALTGTVGVVMPTEASDANSVEWGLALQYNIPYLQQHVKDLGIPAPFKNVIPLIEYTFETPFNRGEHGFATGTVNPGILYESKYYQVGIEALIPVDRSAGNHVGGIISLEIYIDDLLPKLFGHPLFGDE